MGDATAVLGAGRAPKTGDRAAIDSAIGMTFHDNNCNILILRANAPLLSMANRGSYWNHMVIWRPARRLSPRTGLRQKTILCQVVTCLEAWIGGAWEVPGKGQKSGPKAPPIMGVAPTVGCAQGRLRRIASFLSPAAER